VFCVFCLKKQKLRPLKNRVVNLKNFIECTPKIKKLLRKQQNKMAQQQGEQREINLGALSPQELSNLKNMYEEDIKSLSGALQQLRNARDRYKAGENGLEQLKKSKEGM